MLLNLFTAIAALATGVTVGFYIARQSLRPLTQLSQNFDRLAQEQEHTRALTQSQADELLSERRKMRALLASIPVTVVEYNALGQCMAVHPTRVSNTTPFVIPLEQQIGHSVFEVFDQKTATNYQSSISRALKQKRTVEANYTLTIDAQERNFRAFVTPHGRDRVFWVAQDITLFNKTELVLGEVLRTIEEAVLMLNANQEIIFFNYAAEKIFGYQEAEMRGQHPEKLIPERYRAFHRFQVSQFGEQSHSKTRVMGGERKPIIGLAKDGKEVKLRASIAKVGYGIGMVYIVFMGPFEDYG